MVTRLTMELPEHQPLKVDPDIITPPKRSFKEQLIYIKQNITVEPVLTCFIIPGSLSRLATQNLNLDKACRVNLGYDDRVCDALIAREDNKFQKEEMLVQELVSSMEVWKNILQTAIPCLLILFLGAWSDRTGKRKLCILIPIFGELLMCISNILNTYYFYELPVQVAMFFEAFFPAITGGWIATYMGVFSYISDVSSEESRTFRVGIANLCLTAGAPIGNALSGVLLHTLGYYGVFGISCVLYSFSLLYGYFLVKDPEKTDKEKKEEVKTSTVDFIKSFFDPKHVTDTLIVTFKKGPNNRRTKSILVFAGILFVYAPGYGEYTVRYLFTRKRFNWDAMKYSFFSTYYICTHALGALISISLFSRRLKWDDSVLGLISNISHIAGALAIAMAKTSYQMYQATTIEILNATSFTALRSMSSKLVSGDELGKMTSIFNLMEMVTSMIFGPVYSWMYMKTLSYNEGFVYYVSTVLSVPAVAIFGWFFIESRRGIKTSVTREDVEVNEELKTMQISNK